MHYLDLFLPDPNNDPDMNLSDIDAEIQEGFRRQQLLTDWLKGDLPIEAIKDVFADENIDSNEWEDAVCDVVDRVIENKTFISDLDLILPDMQRIEMSCI